MESALDFRAGERELEPPGAGPETRFKKVLKLFGCHNSLCIVRTETFQATKIQNHFLFCDLKDILKTSLSKQAGGSFVLGFSGLSRNGSCTALRVLK